MKEDCNCNDQMISDLLAKLKTANFLLGVAYAGLHLACLEVDHETEIKLKKTMDVIDQNREKQ